MRDLKETIKCLKEREKRADKKGYGGDATHLAFQRHVLVLLSQNIRQKKKPTEYQKILGKHMKEGYSIKMSHEAARGEIEKT